MVPRLLASPKQSPEQVVAGAVEDLVSDSQPPLPLDGDDGVAVLSMFEDFYGLRETTADQPAFADQSASVGLAPFCSAQLLSTPISLLNPSLCLRFCSRARMFGMNSDIIVGRQWAMMVAPLQSQ